MSELNHVQKLLRLKRYERPPEGYFDDFLAEFQRRQRADLIRRPMWEIAWERANIWLDGFRVPAMAYAAILVSAVGVTGLILAHDGASAAPRHAQFAAAQTSAPAAAETVVPSAPTGSVATVSTTPTAFPPSYVLEKRPVSYESPFRF